MKDTPVVRGIRGATTVNKNEAKEIYKATTELLLEMVRNNNNIIADDLAAVHFSSTPDLNSAFPAKTAREMGWTNVPLFCCVEIDVPSSLPRCIRF